MVDVEEARGMAWHGMLWIGDCRRSADGKVA